jgi:HNH endonuclease
MKISTLERFEKKVDKTNSCWIWTASKTNGYGDFRINKKKVKAHRYAFESYVGPIPEDKPHVLHKCDNPPCVNPEHLFAGTNEDNIKDKFNKGRDHNQKKTHCPQGHEYSIENTYLSRNGKSRTCKTCKLARKELI